MAKSLGLGTVRVDAAVRGHYDKLRDNPDADAALILELPQIARSHGGRYDLPTRMVEDCVDMVLQKFGFLGIHEIREAYMQFSAGEFKTASGIMYGGEFNAGNLGAVLSGYNDSRKKIVAAYLDEVEKSEQQKHKRERAQREREAFERSFPDLVRNSKYTHWQHVPTFWYDKATQRGMLQIDKGEAMQIWAEAKRWVMNNENYRFACETFREIKDISERAKTAARKITVFRKLIEPMQNAR